MGKTGLQIFYFYWPSFLCDRHLEFWSLSEKGPPQYFGPIIFKSGGGGACFMCYGILRPDATTVALQKCANALSYSPTTAGQETCWSRAP